MKVTLKNRKLLIVVLMSFTTLHGSESPSMTRKDNIHPLVCALPDYKTLVLKASQPIHKPCNTCLRDCIYCLFCCEGCRNESINSCCTYDGCYGKYYQNDGCHKYPYCHSSEWNTAQICTTCNQPFSCNQTGGCYFGCLFPCPIAGMCCWILPTCTVCTASLNICFCFNACCAFWPDAKFCVAKAENGHSRVLKNRIKLHYKANHDHLDNTRYERCYNEQQNCTKQYCYHTDEKLVHRISELHMRNLLSATDMVSKKILEDLQRALLQKYAHNLDNGLRREVELNHMAHAALLIAHGANPDVPTRIDDVYYRFEIIRQTATSEQKNLLKKIETAPAIIITDALTHIGIARDPAKIILGYITGK